MIHLFHVLLTLSSEKNYSLEWKFSIKIFLSGELRFLKRDRKALCVFLLKISVIRFVDTRRNLSLETVLILGYVVLDSKRFLD